MGTQKKCQLLRIAFAHDDTSEICGTKNHAFMRLSLSPLREFDNWNLMSLSVPKISSVLIPASLFLVPMLEYSNRGFSDFPCHLGLSRTTSAESKPTYLELSLQKKKGR